VKEKHIKIIFILVILVLLILAIYFNISPKNERIVTVSKLKTTNKDVLISNNIRIGIIEFDTINPILSNNKNIQDISRLIFDPLFTLTEDYKLEGVLAKECSKIDKKTYIIKLNSNIVWQDGKLFDSSDVIFTVNILKKLQTESIYYHNIKDIKTIQKIDEYTLKIVTNTEIPYFEYNLIFPIISSKYFDEENYKSKIKNTNPIGTGVFYISQANNESIILKKNTKNSNTKELKIDTISLNLYDSLPRTIEAFKSEKIDIFISSNQNVEEYLKNTKYNKSEYINRKYNYLAMNCNSAVLSNIEVRQAINYAINKEEILKDVFNEKYIISNFPLDFGSFVYDKTNDIIKYDTNSAKNLLIQNGWNYSEEGWENRFKDNLKIELSIVVNEKEINNVKIVNNIKEKLKSIGILLNVKKVNEKEYHNYLKNKNYDMIIVNITYEYSPSLERYFKENNFSNYKNQEISSLLKEAELLINENEIKNKYQRISKIYNEEIPYISLYYDISTMFYSVNLKGNIRPNSYNLFYELDTWYREYEI